MLSFQSYCLVVHSLMGHAFTGTPGAKIQMTVIGKCCKDPTMPALLRLILAWLPKF